MKIEQEKSLLPSVSEFLSIYPPLSKTRASIIDSKKLLIYFHELNLKKQNIEEKETEKIINSTPILISKILKQQKNKMPRTDDVKDAIKSFLYRSNLINKLKTYFTNSNDNNENNTVNMDVHIDTVINKLSESVILEKYDKNKLVIKYDDIGNNCYFLLSGKISVLKPMEYKNIKITYKDYIKYLSNLYYNNEIYMINKVIELNNYTFFKFHSPDKIKNDITYIKSFIKSYCIIKLYSKLKSEIIDYTDINNISKLEQDLMEFNLKFNDININLKEIKENIEKIKQENTKNKTENNYSSVNKLIQKYILDYFSPSEDDIYTMKPYDFLFNDISNRKAYSAILYKYDLFLYLNPGSFFGEMALELNSNNRRNATIRTEEECFMFSLTQKLYNSILVSSIHLIKEYDINFLRKNYFFAEISSKIFDKMYFPMFKLLSKQKNEVIYKQNTSLNSVYFLKEGKIKFEIYLSVIDIYNLMKYFVEFVSEKRKLFKFSDEEIINLRKYYLNDTGLNNLWRSPPIYKEKLSDIKKYEIYNVTNYEAMGLLEFMSLYNNYSCSCYVISKTAKFFEVNKNNLNIIINREYNILNEYYNFAKDRFLIMIKRLYSIKSNFLSIINYKINNNFFYNENEEKFEKQCLSEENKNNSNNYNENYNTRYLNMNKIKKFITYSDCDENKIKNKSSLILKENNNDNYQNISTSPTYKRLKIKKIKLPLNYKLNFEHTDYNNRYESRQCHNNISSFLSFRNTKFNESYFIKNRIDHINNKSNISKINNNNLSKYKTKRSPNNSIIDILLQPEESKSKKNSNNEKVTKLPLKLKKIEKISKKINIGKNYFITLEELKSKFQEKSLDKSVLDSSIVKYNSKVRDKSLLKSKNYKLNSDFFHKGALSPLYSNKLKLKKIIFHRNHNPKNNEDEDINMENTIIKNNDFFLNSFIKKYKSSINFESNA